MQRGNGISRPYQMDSGVKTILRSRDNEEEEEKEEGGLVDLLSFKNNNTVNKNNNHRDEKGESAPFPG